MFYALCGTKDSASVLRLSEFETPVNYFDSKYPAEKYQKESRKFQIKLLKHELQKAVKVQKQIKETKTFIAMERERGNVGELPNFYRFILKLDINDKEAREFFEKKKSLKAVLDELKKDGHPKNPPVDTKTLAQRLKKLESEAVKRKGPKIDPAIQPLIDAGARFVDLNPDIAFLDLTQFKGPKSKLLVTNNTKLKVHLTLDFRTQAELFDILPKCNIHSLTIADWRSSKPFDETLKRKLNSAMQHVVKCQSLTSLALQCDAGDEAISSIEKLPNLKSIKLPKKATDKSLSKLGKLKNIEYIGLDGCWDITGSGFKDFEENRLIKRLSFVQTGFESENLKYLKKFPNLSSIGMFQNCKNEDIRLISELPGIEEIHTDNTFINDHVFDILTKMKKLKKVSLGGCP